MKYRMFNIKCVVLALICALWQGVALSQSANVGLQAVGLARWSDADITHLADLLVQAGGRTEVAYLPFEFTLDKQPTVDPFLDPAFINAIKLTKSVLPRINGTFTLTTQLYFHNQSPRDDYSGTYHPAFRWSAFSRRSDGSFVNNTQADIDFRSMYQKRCLRNAKFLNALYAWGVQNGSVGKLGLVTVPDLEDNAPSLGEFSNVQRFVTETYASVGAGTQFRRSVLSGNTSHPPFASFEKHGDPSVIAGLGAGDTYSNDGTGISIVTGFDSYLTKQKAGVKRGVSVLFWRQFYNGTSTNSSGTFVPPFKRGILTPLTGTPGPGERAALLRVLRAR